MKFLIWLKALFKSKEEKMLYPCKRCDGKFGFGIDDYGGYCAHCYFMAMFWTITDSKEEYFNVNVITQCANCGKFFQQYGNTPTRQYLTRCCSPDCEEVLEPQFRNY